jgi:hypothetical protein
MNSQEVQTTIQIDYKEIFASLSNSWSIKSYSSLCLLWLWTEANEHQNNFLAQQSEKDCLCCTAHWIWKEKKKKDVQTEKVLYELKQFSQLWYEVMHHFLINLEYTHLHTNNSVFQNDNLIIVIYVDNILICESKWTKFEISRQNWVINTKWWTVNHASIT